MAVNNSKDSRINVRSPYFIEAGREAPEPVDIPEVVDPPTNTAPTVTITATSKDPYLGETVTLTAEATDSDGTIVSYIWGGTASPLTTTSITITNTDTVESQTYTVLVTDNDGDSAVAQITINWQEQPQVILPEPEDNNIKCGDTHNEGAFIGEREYTLDVGDKIGDVDITFLSPPVGTASTPVKFTATWDSTTETTGYIGDSAYDDQMTGLGVNPSDLNTSVTEGISNKTTGTQLTINKSASSPDTISLKAFSPIENDSFSFRLDCPDVLAVETKFYSVKGTSATNEITYTDFSGTSQTRSLSEDEEEVISAQTGTVIVTSGTAEVEEGGQSFDLGTPEIEVSGDLEINFLVGIQGEHNRLSDVVNNQLKSELLEFYDNDSALYDKNVNVFDKSQSAEFDDPREFPNNANDNDNEKFWRWLRKEPSISGNRVLNVAFVQTGVTAYHKHSGMYPQFIGQLDVYALYAENSTDSTLFHATDLKNLKNFLDTSSSYGDITNVLIVVDGSSGETPALKTYLGHLQNSTYGLTGKRKGIDDRSEIEIIYGLNYYDSSDVMKDKILEGMRGLGFTV